MVVNDLVTMLQFVETSSMFITGIGIALLFVTFHIGNQRSLATAGLFTGLTSIAYSIFITGVSDNAYTFSTVGVAIILVTALLVFLISDHSAKKVGGTA